MFFDTLAGIVERHLPEFAERMRIASLFRLEGKNNATTEEAVANWEPDEKTVENFRLPFTNLFIEYADGRSSPSHNGTLLFVEDKSTRRIGFLTGWTNKDSNDVTIGAGSFIAFPNADDGYIVGTENQKILAMKTGIRLWAGNKKSLVARPMQLNVEDDITDELHKMSKIDVAQKIKERRIDELISLRNECKLSIDKRAGHCSYLGGIMATISVLVINEPACFIVEERPLMPPGDPKNVTIPRSAGRPHFIVLKPCEIRKRFIYPPKAIDPEQDEVDAEDRRKVGAHERRGHYRRLSSERFKHARGRLLWIDSIWVGPSEAVRGPNRYKVRLDL